MTEKLNIVQSITEPDKRNIWLKDNELKKFGAKGWSTIGGSNAGGGGGTSTDKDALNIYVDFNSFNVTFNDKIFTPDINDSTGNNAVINNKELYNTLYNSLVNTKTIVHILSTNGQYIHIIPTVMCTNDEVIFQMLIGGIMMISVRNK